MTKRRQPKKTSFQVGDRVVRNKAVGTLIAHAQRGDMAGTVVKVTEVLRGSGSTRARIRVRWDNGYEALVEDRQLLHEEAS